MVLGACDKLESRLDQIEMELRMPAPASVSDNATSVAEPVQGAGTSAPLEEALSDRR
jgi:hypothetical protein